jgi:hypothetical protein
MPKSSGGGGRSGRSGGGAVRGSFITDGLVRGLVTGRGTMGSSRRPIPAYRVNLGGGQSTLIPVSQARVIVR